MVIQAARMCVYGSHPFPEPIKEKDALTLQAAENLPSCPLYSIDSPLRVWYNTKLHLCVHLHKIPRAESKKRRTFFRIRNGFSVIREQSRENVFGRVRWV